MLIRRVVYACVMASVFVSVPTRAQWSIVGSHIVTPDPLRYTGEVLCYKAGFIWAGIRSLAYTPDSGKTWHSTSWNMGLVFDIALFDRDTAIVSGEQGVYRTTDRGQSWTSVHTGSYGYYRLFYGVPTSAGLHLIDNGGQIHNSFDNGLTWSTASAGTSGSMVGTRMRDGTLYVGGSTGGVNVYLFRSTDSGKAWMQTAGAFPGDTYSIDVDSCDAARLYLANEEFYDASLPQSTLFVTTNLGTSWSASFSHARPYTSGNLASARHAIYAGTIYNGILRSTDQGISWTNIGGPSTWPDTRNLCVLNDNTLFAMDSAGNVWETVNSGGDSLSFKDGISLLPHTLFANDTITCDSIIRYTKLSFPGCSHSVRSLSVIGSKAPSYRPGVVIGDSVAITLLPLQNGALNASFVASLDDGSSDTIPLLGFGNTPTNSLTVAPHTLFFSDVLTCDSVSRFAHVSRSGCNPPSIISARILGPDSASYTLGELVGDSVHVVLLTKTTGAHHASLVFRNSDGTFDTVALGGSVVPNSTTFWPNSLFTGDTVRCDTLTRSLLGDLRGCQPPLILAVRVIGPDSSSYRIGDFDFSSLSMTLNPGIVGPLHAAAVLQLSDGTSDTILLGGTAVDAANTWSISTHTLFANDTALCDSITRVIRCTLQGCAPPTIASARISGPDSAGYGLSIVRPDSIAVSLAPLTIGDHLAWLILTGSDGRVDTVTLHGTVAPKPRTISIEPATLFATDTARCDSVVRSLSIHGAGCETLAVSGFSIIGDDSSAYRLGALHSNSIDVSLLSLVHGSHHAALVVTMSDGSRDTVALAGYVQREANALSLSAKSLFDGDTARCDTVTRVLALKRTGCLPPSIRTISIVGADSASYRMTPSFDSISISLLPVTTGSVPAMLVVQLADGSSDTTFLNGACSNEGGTVSISPRALFEDDTVRCDSLSRTVSIHTGGCVPPMLSGWSIVGRDSAGFVAIAMAPDSFLVTLRPRREGSQTASLILRFSDGSRDTVSLAGVHDPARSIALNLTPLDLGALQPCESHDTVIPYTNTSCVPVTFIAWRMLHYGDGLQVYNFDVQPLTIPPGQTGSMHITFDGRHTGLIYDTVVVILGTDSDSVRRIPVQTYIPPVDSVNFFVNLPAQLNPGEQIVAKVLPDRSVSGKGLTSISGVIVFPMDNFQYDSVSVPQNAILTSGLPYRAGRTSRVPFALSDASGLTLDPATPVLQLWLETRLSDTNDYRVALDSLALNESDPSYSNCTLATSSVGASAGYSPACGDRLLIQTLAMRELLFVDDPWPNPATETFSVHLHNPSEQIVTYELVDALGITRNRGTTQQNALSVDLQDVPPGVYYLRVRVPIGSWEIRKIAVRR